MLTIWSRAGRNPGTCRGISHVSNVSLAARRPRVIKSQGSWVFGTPTSTFVYTAIFTAGIAIDGKAKHKRNEQWREAFVQLREEMAQPSADIDTTQSAVEEHEIMDYVGDLAVEQLASEGLDWEHIHQVAGMELVNDNVFQKTQAKVDFEHITEHLWELLEFDSRFPSTQSLEWLVNTGHEILRRNLPPQSLWSDDHARRRALTTRYTSKKLAIQELSIGLLIHSLLAYAQDTGLWQINLEELSPPIRKMLSLDAESRWQVRNELRGKIVDIESLVGDPSIEEIRNVTSGLRSITPLYRQDNDGDFYDICQQMNSSIKKLLLGNGAKYRDQVADKITKVCHNLLASSAGPDVQTFNILLCGFKRWGLVEIVDQVISALEVCKTRPNEITCAAILDHYVQGNRPEDFSRFVARMRGVGDALMLARPDITVDETNEKRLIRVNEQKVYQKVHANPFVFNSLMLGALKFAGVDRALEIYFEMKEDGWGLDVLGLTHFLADCAQRSDWNNGLYIWEEINSIKTRAKTSHMQRAYSIMLSLCSVSGETAAFNQILKEVVNRGFDRKTILSAAMSYTDKTRDQTPRKIPAWTADNVLIALSDYAGHTMPSNSEMPPQPIVPPEKLEPTTPPVASLNDEETWSAWLEHELGDKPQKR